MRGVQPLSPPRPPQVPTQAKLSLWLCHFITEDKLTYSEVHRYKVYNTLNFESYYF